jgi:hypothetical protein
MPRNDRSSSMSTANPAQQGGAQNPTPQQQGQQQGQSSGGSQQQGSPIIRDWASI